MNIPDDILLFTGFSLGHAAYSICDLEDPELLIPFALYEDEGKQAVHRFEAESQEEAINSADAFISKNVSAYNLLSFAREGAMSDENGNKVDVLCVKTWSKTCEAAISIIQPFIPFHVNKSFKLVGETIVQVNDQGLDNPSEFIQIIEEGTSMHQAAGPLYESWRV